MKNKEKVISVSDLDIGYGNKKVLSNVDFDVLKGKFVSILGPNGAGKTTLLLTLAKILKPIKGTIFIKNTPLNKIQISNMAKLISVLFTKRSNPPFFDVFSYVALGRYPHTNILGKLTKRDKKIVEDALNLVGALYLKEKPIEMLSDGERQKVYIARGLAQEPEIMILDEPTIHLDLKHKVEIISILKNLCTKKNITIIASLHQLELAMKVSDYVILVKDGRIIAKGTPEQILTQENVSRLYNFNGVTFNPLLGSIEISQQYNKSQPMIFVLGGMGYGTPIYRVLSRKGFCISTGILYKNDIDWFIAKQMNAICIDETPFLPIKDEKISKCKELIKDSIMIIDPIPDSNTLYNKSKIINSAINFNKKVILFNQTKTNPNSEYVINLNKLDELDFILDGVRHDKIFNNYNNN